MYANAIRILSKGYLPISLLLPFKLQEVLNQVKKAIQVTNPDYDIVTRKLHLYHDIKLNKYILRYSKNEEVNLIVQFPVLFQPYIQKQIILYQIKTLPVPIVDLSKNVNSYINLRFVKTYIALYEETYISLRQQELRNCKSIGY